MYFQFKNIDIHVKTTVTPPEVWGFTYRTTFNNYVVIISESLSPEATIEVLSHELSHIREHCNGLSAINIDGECTFNKLYLRGRDSNLINGLLEQLEMIGVN